MPFVRTALGLACVCAVVSACSGETKDIPVAVTGIPSPPPISSSTGTDAATTDGGTLPSDGGDGGTACLPDATFAFDSAYGGTLAIRGRIALPASLPAGRGLAVSIQAEVGGEVKQQPFSTLAITDSFTYRIGGLIPGRYILRMQADATGNGSVVDPGDYDGYFDGTAAGPILVRADAVAVEVKDVCRDTVNFGPGIKL